MTGMLALMSGARADDLARIPDVLRLKWTEEKARMMEAPWQQNERQEIKTGLDSSVELRSGRSRSTPGLSAVT